ncbi:MAG TPA: hypothetical protein VN654_28805 [Vicinamibacterales bacterium]|jgi:hypothetical protein|nr:hypothetical protein [Vicinamibacterales bacterium]
MPVTLTPEAQQRHTLTPEAQQRHIGDLVMRIEGEFLETPGLRLTIPEAQDRFDIDELTCEALLDTLVAASVLFRTGDGVYGRLFPHNAAA